MSAGGATRPETRRVRVAAELPAVARSLAAAFGEDPVMAHLIASGRRPRELARLFTKLAASYARVGEVWSGAEGRAAALWAPPGTYPIGGREGAGQLATALRVFGGRPFRSLATELAIVGGLPKQPYWYLEAIGVDPELHGRGAGSALLDVKLAELDASGEPAHLTASSARSRALYERHGFEATERVELPLGGPPVWRMWREPSV